VPQQITGSTTPYVKILSASEQPEVYTDEDGVLTIAPEVCDDTTSPTASPSSTVSSATTTKLSTATSLLGLGSALMMFTPTNSRVTTVLPGLAMLASVAWVQADEHTSCMPTLTIEVGVPEMAPVTERFGETTHYLAATVDTVVWGYYDPAATAATAPVTMASGETVTVEVITHHSGHDVSYKRTHDNSIQRYIARLMALGSIHTYVINIFLTFSPFFPSSTFSPRPTTVVRQDDPWR